MKSELIAHLLDPAAHQMTDPRATLRTFFAALAARNTSPVDILFGPADSITEGAGASSQANRWQNLVRDGLRAKFQPAGVAGGAGYVPAFTYYNNPATYSGTYTQPSTNGLGFLGITMSAAATWTLTFTGTALDIFYTKQAGGGTLTVSVDGASSGTGFATINTANATTVNSAVTRVGGLTAGSHTVVITASVATAIFEGVMVYNGDETKGIRTWNNAHSGHTAGVFNNSRPAWQNAVTTIQPSLIILALGTNDWRTATGQPDMYSYGTSLANLITTTRALCTIPPSVLLIPPYQPATGTNTSAVGLQPFINMAAKVAAKTSEVHFLNMFQRFGGMGLQSAQRGLLSADNIHPSDKGHQFMADAVLGRLTP